ncbi:MAG: pyrroloquinoline quinone-dependent dehydrogenase [Pirellulales bacterium]
MRKLNDPRAIIASTMVVLLLARVALAQRDPTQSDPGHSGTGDGQWRHYGGDHGHSRYAPLDQVNRRNVTQLEIAWRWESADAEIAKADRRYSPGQFKVTPLLVDGVLYASTGLSQVAAIDPASGKTLWVYDPKSYERGRPTNSGFQHRGLEYWTDGTAKRIIIATGGRQLVSIDVATGKPDPRFGEGGSVDLSAGLGRKIDDRQYGFNSPTTVCRDTIVVGSIVFDAPTQTRMPPGHVRGYDVRTGQQKWIFHTIPQPGEFGVQSWEDESWKEAGNTNVWSTISADDELGYVYLPLSTPTNDWYGGHRRGDNLFAESIVCLEAETGTRVWHFQAVHHGLWDFDFPCGPNLADITVDGRKIKAVAQVSKQGFCYVLDRVTGEPVWPIEERPVPQSTVSGEKTSPTQPFPTRPPAFERQGLTVDDLIDFTPELRAQAIEILQQYAHGPIFTPPVVTGAKGLKGTAQLPGPAGGANWGGAALDPETNFLYVPSMTLPFLIGLSEPDSNRSNFRYIRTGPFTIEGPQGLPLVKPPYGRITAIDLNRGEIVWQVPHGNGPRDHPAIKHLGLGPLGGAANGVLSNGGGVLTKELFFVIQAEEAPESPALRMGDTGYLRAFDKTDGKLVWEKRIDSTPHGTPMTYSHQGKQYIVLAVGGLRQKSELVAFALP